METIMFSVKQWLWLEIKIKSVKVSQSKHISYTAMHNKEIRCALNKASAHYAYTSKNFI